MTFVSSKSGLLVEDEPVYKSDVGSYKIYTALITQTGTSVPTVNVFKNTIGDIVWTYDNPGYYSANLIGAFVTGKTFLYVGAITGNTSIGPGVIEFIGNVDPDSVQLNTQSNLFVSQNNQLVNTPIEIRVYN